MHPQSLELLAQHELTVTVAVDPRVQTGGNQPTCLLLSSTIFCYEQCGEFPTSLNIATRILCSINSWPCRRQPGRLEQGDKFGPAKETLDRFSVYLIKMCTSQTGMESETSIDLQLSILRHLHTPILVLSPSYTTVFANRAFERVLGLVDPLSLTSTRLIGHTLAQIGIRLLYNRSWIIVLENLLAATKQSREGGTRHGESDPVHEADAVVDNSDLRFEDRYFRILISTLTTDDGMHFIFSLERSAQIYKHMHSPDSLSSDEGISVTPSTPKRNPTIDKSKDSFRIKKFIFDSSSVMGFILTADEKVYMTNRKTREAIGDIMGGEQGCDGPTMRKRWEVWDDKFSRKLNDSEFPGMKLVRTRQPFANYRCGFTHSMTGKRLIMNVSGECIYDEDTGEFLGGVCWCHDLQEYSDFLSEEQARLLLSHETICDLMPHLVWTGTPDGEVDWYSRRWYDFTGMSREESIGKGFYQAIHLEDLPRLVGKWNYYREQGSECEVEVRYRRKDGLFRWMLVRAVPLRDERGNILKWYGTTTDIHDLVIARIDAARNKLQMLTVLAHAEVNLFSIDMNRIITMAEGAMQWDTESAAYDVNNKSTLVGKDAILVAEQTQPGGIPGYQKIVLDVLSGAVDVAQSEDIIGGRCYRTRIVADLEYDPEDGARKPTLKGALGLSIDITDVKARAVLAVDNARLTMEEQAAKDSNRMKSQFLANMSHELRTPTAGVIGMAELLGDDPNLTSEQKEYVNSIQLSAKALLTIVNDILDFSKIESGRLDIEEVPFSLSSVTGELCKLLSMFAEQKGLDFIYENNMEQDVELLGDPGRVRQVLSNLLTNALKFTRQGFVKLKVSSTTKRAEDNHEVLEVQFVIEDTGIGIESSVLEKLFKPFSQGDASTARLYGGTGLGLTISKNLASLMHGSIELESTPQVGSKATFTVPFKVSTWSDESFLPSSSPPNPGFRYHIPPSNSPSWAQPITHRAMSQDLLNQQISSSVTEFAPPPISRSRKGSVAPLSRQSSIDTITSLPPSLTPEQRSRTHILVVEDNAINQTIAIKNIRKLGFPVTAVWNGREALSYLRHPSPTQPRPAIILMDVQMPVLDGYEATRILRSDTDFSEPCPPSRPQLANVSEGRRLSVTLDGAELTDSAIGGSGGGSPAGSTRNRGPSIHRRLSRGHDQGMGSLRDIPVIAMTASAIQGDKEKCHDAGMDDYLPKPVNRGQLEEMLVKWARRRRSD